MERLLPCPFCGGEGAISCMAGGSNDPNIYYVVQCKSCGAKAKATPVNIFCNNANHGQEAIKAWNTRRQ